MLIASKSGNITAATLISESNQEWCLLVEKREVRIRKADTRQRVFENMSDALTWTGAEQELIDHFVSQEAVPTNPEGLGCSSTLQPQAIPEATLAQLGLDDAAYDDSFLPAFLAMNDGLDQPGGVWYLHDTKPVYDPGSGAWVSSGNAWEVGGDCSEGLVETPAFQRFIRPECSLIRIVGQAEALPVYEREAYLPGSM